MVDVVDVLCVVVLLACWAGVEYLKGFMDWLRDTG